ncbi:methyl-accepting chemotaxis protein [Desulfovibrio sp. JC022]|uniref:methyl-accepting chemotaxis protein n=1 Tax=Desulfovibrio sp. JC022 TaxID=2593642 RepID=UPI0013D53D89|nr:methyl-accepting chemotaxis protein [Desulfovibrio sp. JC022]NDV22323.1 PAS domain-containing protein [Desulfovibrio sp. JC022]
MNFKSINTGLSILITAIVSISVIAFVVVVSSMTNSAVLSIQEQNMGVLNNKIVNEVGQFLELSKSDLADYASSADLQNAFTDEAARARIIKHLRQKMGNNSKLATLAAFGLDGNIVFGLKSNGQSAAGADLRSRKYVQKILNGSNFAVSEVLKSVLDDRFIVVMAVPVRNEQGQLLGGFFYSVDWQKYSMEMIGDISIGEDGYAYMLDNKGRIIAHKVNQDLILKDISSHQFVKDSLAAPKGKTEYEWEGRAKIQSFQVVPSTGWVVCMSAYVSDLTRAAIEERNILIVMGTLMVLLLVGVIVFTIRKQVTGPMATIRDFTSEIAHGNFKAELNGKYVCELKDLSENIDFMVAELKNKLGFSEGVLKGLVLPCSIVGPNDDILWANSQICELIETSTGPEQAIGMDPGEFFYNERGRKTLSQQAIEEEHQIQQEVEYTTVKGNLKSIMISTTPFYDMDKNMLGSVTIWIDMTEIREQQRKIEENNIMISEAAASATEVSNQVSGFSEALSAQVEQSSRGAEEQSVMASEAATAMDEMNSTVFEVARNASTAAELADASQQKAGEGEQKVEQAVETITQIRVQSDQMQKDMADLGKQADGIGNIMGVISDIADQTNLLALNAAIEAARAGDAGRGFAVVADEVRKLAESTMNATSEVGEYISRIQDSAKTNITNTEKSTKAIGEVTELVNQSGDILKEIVEKVSETADQVRSIATASEEQSAASEEISRSTGQINTIASETAQAMNESAEAVSRMSELAKELDGIIARMQG